MNLGFHYDANSAKNAQKDSTISQTDKYLVWIVNAEYITTRNGVKGMTFEVMTKDKETASFSLYYEKADGTPIFGKDNINAIITCAGVNGNLSAVPKMLNRYDHVAGKKIDKNCFVAPELEKRYLGVLLERDEYKKDDGSTGYRMNLVAPFQAQTELTAGELLNGVTEPEVIARLLTRLANKEQKKPQPVTYTQEPVAYTQGGYAIHNEPPKDDLPF